MKPKPINRKEFLAALGKLGAGCMCAAAAGMSAALGAQESPKPAQSSTTPSPVATKPGDKTIEREAKRMEFGDLWVRRFFDVLDQTLDEGTRKKIMMLNGKTCFAAYAGPNKHHPGPDAVEKFKAWIAKNGRDRGYSIDGNIVTFEYVGSAETGQAAPERVCLCSMAEAQTAGTFSPTYCYCSVGYVKEMHERILGRPVEVELVDAVLWGGKRCRFRFSLA
jgi:hypothetical protein